MAITLSEILARARTLATQTRGDANLSPVIDNRAGLRALLNHVMMDVYRAKANDPKFLRDITVKSTVTITGGSGTVPTTWMKEFLHLANFVDANNSLITYFDNVIDYNSGTTYNQLGYCYIDGDTLKYRAPSPAFETYSGNLDVTTPAIPDVDTSMTFPSESTENDVIKMLAIELVSGVAATV